MALPSKRYPSPNPKYQFIGDNYRKYGEVPGYIYDPYTDRYKRDPREQERLARESGLIKEEPSLAESLLPVVAGAGAIYAGKEIGKNIIPEGGLSAIPGKLGALLGIGKEEAAKEVAKTGLEQAASITSATTPAVSGLPGAPEIISASRVPAATSSPGMFALEGVGSAGNALLPVAGAIGAYDVLANDRGPGRGALQGAASGAAIGSYFGPAGAGIGAGIGGLLGLAKGLFGGESRTKVEDKRIESLKKAGILPADYQFKETSKEQAKAANPEFYKTRDEKYLKPQDIVGYAAFYERDPSWAAKPLDEKLSVAQEFLNAGAVREHKGTIDLDEGKLAAFKATPAPSPQVDALKTAEANAIANIQNKKKTYNGRGLLALGQGRT